MCSATRHVRFVPIADIHQLSWSCRLDASVVVLTGEFEPSFGDFNQIGLFFFGSSLLRGGQSLLSTAAILFSFADHALAAETFRKKRFREEDVEDPVGCQLDLGPSLLSRIASAFASCVTLAAFHAGFGRQGRFVPQL